MIFNLCTADLRSSTLEEIRSDFDPLFFSKGSLHYDENTAFSRQASWFYEPEKFFIRDKMANAKTPRFCRSVNQPLYQRSCSQCDHMARFFTVHAPT